MIRIFLITIFTICYAAVSLADDNENNRIQSLEEINADLERRKKELQPFDPKDVKVDLESLGLDDVSKKKEEEKFIKEIQEEKKQDETILEEPKEEKPEVKKDEAPPVLLPEIKPQEEPKPTEPFLPPALRPSKPQAEVNKEEKTAPETESPSEEKSANEGIINRIRNILNSQNKEEKLAEKSSEETKTEVKPQEKKEFINETKRKNLEKRKSAKEKQKRWNEEREAERKKKLQELRDKYLQEQAPDEDELLAKDYLDSSENIIPQRKNLNTFIVEEAPPTPLIATYRTKDNLHIPLIMTPKERLDILFTTISIGSISAFNEAYNYIRNPNVKNDNGDTVLTYAILIKRYPVMTSILSKGADPNMPNNLGYTPINIALEMQDFRALEILSENRADLKYIDAFGRNYLMHAARLGNLAAVALLIDKGIDINASDNEGSTALTIAYKSGQNVVATYLLKHGANNRITRQYNPQEQSLIKELDDSWK